MFSPLTISPQRKAILEEVKRYGEVHNVPNISDINASFLEHLVTIKKAKNILEIGTAHGFSTICMGNVVETFGGKLITIDFSQPTFKTAQKNIQKAGLENTVELLFGNALDIIPKLPGEFDFIFIDGMMKQTVDFLGVIWNKTQHQGVIVIDDVIKFKHKMVGLDDFLAKNSIHSVILPIDGDDGVMLIIKDSSITLL